MKMTCSKIVDCVNIDVVVSKYAISPCNGKENRKGDVTFMTVLGVLVCEPVTSDEKERGGCHFHDTIYHLLVLFACRFSSRINLYPVLNITSPHLIIHMGGTLLWA
jgi:hypothetical protein